ncbi:MAG: helix-turn-helix transcriptional regulator [Clostridia bacterium]|nr:helix-turn-helix transcriptional regulator [Clostridia bacterium]
MKDKIKERRLELGLTLEEVANAVGVAKSTVKKWESGQIASKSELFRYDGTVRICFLL